MLGLGRGKLESKCNKNHLPERLSPQLRGFFLWVTPKENQSIRLQLAFDPSSLQSSKFLMRHCPKLWKSAQKPTCDTYRFFERWKKLLRFKIACEEKRMALDGVRIASDFWRVVAGRRSKLRIEILWSRRKEDRVVDWLWKTSFCSRGIVKRSTKNCRI